MALISISGEPGCRHEELARLAAQQLSFELVSESRLASLMADEFGADAKIPERVYPHVVSSILARLATSHHLVIATPGSELLFKNFPGVLRVSVVAPETRRLGNLMLDHRLERAAARQLLRETASQQRRERKARFGMAHLPPYLFDLVLNAESLDTPQMMEVLRAAVATRGLIEQGLLSAAAEAQLQFQIRLRLAKHGIVPAGKAKLTQKPFGHASEELFANLLDFYRIAWEYEPRSFSLQWDKDGNVTEAFTPDFYLPEFDLYVELTTMKQALVTKKNRKIKLLRAIYPHVNIQVFYQKDFQDLVSKYGLTERVPS